MARFLSGCEEQADAQDINKDATPHRCTRPLCPQGRMKEKIAGSKVLGPWEINKGDGRPELLLNKTISETPPGRRSAGDHQRLQNCVMGGGIRQ